MPDKMKITSLLAFCLFGIIAANSQSGHVSMKDLQLLAGNWKGNLMYLDYSTNTNHTIPANLNIRPLEKSRRLIFSNTYTNEAGANSIDTLTISEDGKKINNEIVRSVSLLKNGNTEIITTYLGTDGNENKPAIIKHAYIIGRSTFIRRKHVQFIGENDWLERSTYSYVRK